MAESLSKFDKLRLIDSSTPTGHYIADKAKDILNKYGLVDNGLHAISLLDSWIDGGSKFSKNLGKLSSAVGNVSNYILNPALLGLSVGESGSSYVDNFVVGIFGSYMFSNSHEGVENKYQYARTKFLEFLDKGTIELYYLSDKNQIICYINDLKKFNEVLDKLNQME